MTGMGKAQGTVLDTPVRLEVKSVNHRFCEVNFRGPGRYQALDIQICQYVREKINRGHVDIYLFEEKTALVSHAEIEAYKNYHKYLGQVASELQLDENVTLQHLLPGVGSWIYKEMDPKLVLTDLIPILDKALNDMIQMREQEGGNLKKDISERLITIEKIKDNVSDLRDDVKQELEERFEKRISEKLENYKEIDPQRLHMEVVYNLEKMDISEELKRLESHIKQMKSFIDLKAPVGRKVDFLIQEFNREFNTIGSKSQNAKIAHLVVDAKSEIEKMREQIQNVE